MEINYLLVIFGIILLISIIRGATKGMLRIVFGIVAWVILILFVNYGSTYVHDYINVNTQIPVVVQEKINERLHDKYTLSEEEQAGTGEDAVLFSVPARIRNKVMETVRNSVEETITLIALELTDAAIKGISTIICVVAGILLLIIIDKLLKLIGLVPGIHGFNRTLGIVAGLLEGLLIIWLLMYIADCFPTTTYGEFIHEYTESSQILLVLKETNIIARIIGI